MARVFSFVWILLTIALGSVGLMYVADWLASARVDHRGVAVADVASEVAARIAIEDRKLLVSEILDMVKSNRYIKKRSCLGDDHGRRQPVPRRDQCSWVRDRMYRGC
jgi:hypothetical protein